MEVLHFGMKKPTPLRDLLAGDPQWMAKLEACLTCGACSSGCPAAGIDDMDPRKAIRLVSLGLEEELIQSNWIFKCTGCDRCTYVCPMNIQIGAMITRARSLRDRASLPGKAQATCDLHRDKGNNMQIATDEWLDTVDWMKDELAESIPDLEVPIDKEGAEFFCHHQLQAAAVPSGRLAGRDEDFPRRQSGLDHAQHLVGRNQLLHVLRRPEKLGTKPA